jgi:hypothetical protein
MRAGAGDGGEGVVGGMAAGGGGNEEWVVVVWWCLVWAGAAGGASGRGRRASVEASPGGRTYSAAVLPLLATEARQRAAGRVEAVVDDEVEGERAVRGRRWAIALCWGLFVVLLACKTRVRLHVDAG